MRTGNRSKAFAFACAVGVGLLVPASCEDPVGAPGDLSAVSSNVQGHFHRATIPARDIVDPPPGGAIYTSTTELGHSHTVGLSNTQLTDLQQKGAAVSIGSSSSGSPSHSHTFPFER